MWRPRLSFPLRLFHENEILFGHDSTPFITAVEYDGKNSMETFFRKGNKVTSRKEIFKPFIFLIHSRHFLDGMRGG